MHENDLTNEEWTPIAAKKPQPTVDTTSAVSVKGVELSEKNITIGKDTSYKLCAFIKPANADDDRVTWDSGNYNIASVNETGLVCGMSKGTTNIKVTTHDGDYSATCKVTVTIPVTSLSISKSEVILKIGETTQLIATVFPEEADNQSVSWTSNNTDIATVDNDGNVIAKSAGTATITVKTNDGGYKRTCTVYVNPIKVTGVSLISDCTMFVGDDEPLVATVKPNTASNQNVTWKSNNTNVATVDAKGVVRAKKAGSATITVTTVDGGFTANCIVKVETPADGITLSNRTLTIENGSSATLTATVTPTNATYSDIYYISSNPKVATIRQTTKSGNKTTFVVNAAGTGSAQLTFMTHNSITAYCMVTVPIHPTGVVICGIPAEMRVENNYSLSACVYPTNATNTAVTWSSSNTKVAEIGASGLVCAKAVGKTTITVTTVDGHKTASFEATVKSIDAPPLFKPKFDLPYYPENPKTTPNSEMPAANDPLGCINEYGRTPASLTAESWYYLVKSISNNIIITNTHYTVSPPVPSGKKVDEKWYYITAPDDTYCMHIATQVDTYDAEAYCKADVYDNDFNLLGHIGEIIDIQGGNKYYIRTYGIGAYYLYVNMVAYSYVSRHFHVDSSIRNQLNKSIISPNNFNNYLKRADAIYDTMYELTGVIPCNGAKIEIKHEYMEDTAQFVRIGQPYMYYTDVISTLREIQSAPRNWWLAGSAHEIGHLFDEKANKKWRFASEGMASYKAWLAIERLGGVIYAERLDDNSKKAHFKPLQYNWDKNLADHIKGILPDPDNNPYPCRILIDTVKYGDSFSCGDDIVFILNPIIDAVGFVKGFEILSKVFKSYEITDINNMFKIENYPYKFTRQKMLGSFIDRCSYYLSEHFGYVVDLKDYWMEGTKQFYKLNTELDLSQF